MRYLCHCSKIGRLVESRTCALVIQLKPRLASLLDFALQGISSQIYATVSVLFQSSSLDLIVITRMQPYSGRVLFVFGTRPEAVKLCPLILMMQDVGLYQVVVCVTGQHRSMLDQALEAFGVRVDHDLSVMRPGQSLFHVTARIIEGLEAVFEREQPALTVVQGDTTSTLCGALAAFYSRVPVAHVEAGLRTGDLSRPFPEEANRILTARLATLHFAPTGKAAEALRREEAAGIIQVTGNTGIDAIRLIKERVEKGCYDGSDLPKITEGRKLLVVTAHRRESFGPPLERICAALARLSERPDVQIIVSAHPQPKVEETVRRLLSRTEVTVIPAMDYVPFISLMMRAHVLITDSGGIQEEGPFLGRPILVTRDKTERLEGVEAGTAKLVGTDTERIIRETNLLLDDPAEYERMACAHNPYGDGYACERIEAAIRDFLGVGAPAQME